MSGLTFAQGELHSAQLSPRAQAVLKAYLRHGPSPQVPSSRLLRARFAPTLSRAQWARGIRELVAAGILFPTATQTLVAVPVGGLR